MMNCPHCNVHIDEHPASPCLDRWVAKDVMGWRVNSIRVTKFTNDTYYCSSSQTIKPISVRDWLPGTSISAAWEVVEKVIDPSEDEFDIHFVDGWIATFSIVGRGVHSCVEPFSAPLAICRAAIKASQ